MIGILKLLLVLTSMSMYMSDDYGYDDPYETGGGGGYDYGGDGGEYNGGESMPPPPEPILTELATIEAINSFVLEISSKPIVMGYFDLSTNEDDKVAFDRVFEKEKENYEFAFTTNPDVLKAMKYVGCVVIVYKPSKDVNEKYEKSKSRYPSKNIKASALEKFILEKSLPLVGQKTKENALRYEKLQSPEVTLFYQINVEQNTKQFDYYANRLRKIAKDNTKFVFNMALSEDFASDMESQFGLVPLDANQVSVGLRDGQLHYRVLTSFSVDNMKELLANYQKGIKTGLLFHEVEYPEEPKMQQQDIPQEESGVTSVVTLTNDNFREVVQKGSKDVMVDFYAPWCGHCKSLTPEYNALADKLKEIPSVTIAKMDATNNDVPSGFDVQGYPTLIFVPGDKSISPIPYEGERESSAMLDFIKSHATTKF